MNGADDVLRTVVFTFDAGQQLTEHASPKVEGDTDGSFLAISITRERVMLYTDYFEQYPVYIRGSFELSNVPGVLVRPGDQLRLDSVREFLMMGTTLASEPCLSANVQRLRPAGDSPLSVRSLGYHAFARSMPVRHP